MRDSIKKILSGFLAVICFALAVNPVHIEANVTAGEAQSLIDGIVAYKENENGCTSPDTLVKKLEETAGDGSEWFVLAFERAGLEADYTSYAEALVSAEENASYLSATSKQRMALVMLACGADESNAFISETASETPEQLGIMSRVFGLHLLNNGAVSENYTAEGLIDSILSMRLDDGGWAVIGTAADTDVTAMTVQALAPYYNENEEVKAAVDNALDLLSGKQTESGGFTSFGTENAESAAQVVIALTSLGIDPDSDERYIKNGNSVLDGLLKYRNDDGSFSHAGDGKYSGSATYQALLALVAVERLQDGKNSLYVFEKSVETQINETSESVNADNENPENEVSDTAATENNAAAEDTSSTGFNLKKAIMLGIAVLAAGLCIAGLFIKEGNRKFYTAVVIICLVLEAAVGFTKISSKEEYRASAEDVQENAAGTVTLTIRCDTVKDEESEYIPEDGVILPVTEFEISENETVYDVLVEAAKKYGIQMENKGSSGGMAYISGIAYLYEQQYGELSGWIYMVNGTAPSVGCSDFTLSDGDVIEWHYTRDLGRDVGALMGTDQED